MAARIIRRQLSRTPSHCPPVTASPNVGRVTEAELKPTSNPGIVTTPKAAQVPVYHLTISHGKRTIDEAPTPSVLGKLRTTPSTDTTKAAATANGLLVHLPIAEALHNPQAPRTAEQITEVPSLSVLSKLRTQGEKVFTTPKKDDRDDDAAFARKARDTPGAADLGNRGGTNDGEQLRSGLGSPPQALRSLP